MNYSIANAHQNVHTYMLYLFLVNFKVKSITDHCQKKC